MAYPPAPPLLLTRRLSSFLHSSLESLKENKDQQPAHTTLQTALLVTPSGKLLAYESPLPVRTLRTHCSVAASLWTIHASSSPSVAVALNQTAPVNPAPPASQTSPPLAPTPSTSDFASPVDEGHEEEPYHDGSAPVSIAASFNGGAIFVIRRLRCGLLFACSTPSPNSSTSRPPTATDPVATLSLIDPTASSSSAAPQSSLLPQSTLPVLPRPPPNAGPSSQKPPSASTVVQQTTSSSSSSTASPTPIKAPPKQAPEAAGSLAPAASVRTMATAETFETAPSGISQRADEEAGASTEDGGHGADGEAEADTDRDANADAASTTTTGTTTTVGGSGKNGSVAATLAIARQQVDELARLLDEKLGSLSVPEENIGINGFC
ncbi:hypothetical protein SEUCBS139899_008217 [Sporothrix eucalyptigena]|uniref:Uncharacterized protein n=1 Tax=Sporothrix eucalyptigena TaxID=1812306 RepID=A0ABP0BVA0_9PEZI